MQKLVTIALRGTDKIQHGLVEEHLADLLRQGWKIVSVTAVGSTGGGGESSYTMTAGWVVVLMEKA